MKNRGERAKRDHQKGHGNGLSTCQFWFVLSQIVLPGRALTPTYRKGRGKEGAEKNKKNLILARTRHAALNFCSNRVYHIETTHSVCHKRASSTKGKGKGGDRGGKKQTDTVSPQKKKTKKYQSN